MDKIVFNNTVLRDGHQSLAATRMRTGQMLPACELLDNFGFGCLETWGGATIDAGLRFLGEFPFDRLDALRKACPKTKHMMLLRGQNIVQYSNFPDDVVTAFVKTAADHGMDIFRIFDALNDPRNMKCAIQAARDAGAEPHGTICYTSSPVHTNEKFVELGVELEQYGATTIVIKDMAGLIPPYRAADIIRGLKKKVNVPVWLHTHDTAGLGAATYCEAVNAGVDAIDVSIVPFANGTGQPDTIRMYSHLEDHPRRPDFTKGHFDALARLRAHFTKVYAELSDFTGHKNEVVDSDALVYQVPGGMLSNFRTQLKEQKMEDKFEEVFAEIPVVREALGWIPLVTPTSQIVGVQAMLNVKFGRWKNFSPQAIDIALGYYGQPPAEIDPDVQKLASEKAGKEPITVRPADLKEPAMDKLREELKEAGLPVNDEHAVIYAMFPEQLKKIYKEPKEEPAARKAPAPKPAPAAKAAPQAAPAAKAAPAPSRTPTGGVGRKTRLALTVEGKRHEVTVEEV